VIYLDNAATSHPKPEGVKAAISDYLDNVGASPGRSGHQLAAAAGRLLFQTRRAVARLFRLDDSGNIIFTQNATASLNLALFGLLRPGDRVLTGSLEHNSVMRPLRQLQKSHKITIDILPGNAGSHYDLNLLERWCATKNYRLAVINHASNVTGSLAPLAQMLPLFRKHGIISVVDGAQSAGACAIDLQALDPDIFCFTGHKSLYGPSGTGGFYIRPDCPATPLIFGGTGSRSENEEQPDFRPDCYESGTPNTMGLAGLKAGIEFIEKTGLAQIQRHEQKLIARLESGLRQIANLSLHGPFAEEQRVPLFSFSIKGLSPSEIGFRLDREFSILTRVGLHCAPRAHQSIGTWPQGAVRLAPGYFNCLEEMDAVINAVAEIAGEKT